jgi:hypothetical protein
VDVCRGSAMPFFVNDRFLQLAHANDLVLYLW